MYRERFGESPRETLSTAGARSRRPLPARAWRGWQGSIPIPNNTTQELALVNDSSPESGLVHATYHSIEEVNEVLGATG